MSEYNFENKNITKKNPPPSQYSMSFTGKHTEVVYIIVSINIIIGKDMYTVHYV